jgi:starch-binding outer membrane protein, SusD/RagB family
MRLQFRFLLPAALVLSTVSLSCKKDWLDEKPDQSLVVPISIDDFQSLLDNPTGDNSGAPMNAAHSILDEASTTDMFVTDAAYANRDPLEKNIYIWAADIYKGTADYSEWGYPYKRIFYTNVVLEGIEKIEPVSSQEVTEWNQAKGSALFLRGLSHYDIARQFCKPYDNATCSTDLGIPLRLKSDFNELSKRATVKETYDQILSDLKESRNLLPIADPINNLYRLRPTKAAAEAMLARVYLSMSNYDSAFQYANICLQHYSSLLDYNTINVSPTVSRAFTIFNPEVIFHMEANIWAILLTGSMSVDSNFYNSYQVDDLRKKLFFRSAGGFKKYRGSYIGSSSIFFAGLATDELYLIRAECCARKGLLSKALEDLNTLLEKRWDNNAGQYSPIIPSDQEAALSRILEERRKELCFRGIRWTDLRRLNKDPNRQITLSRTVNGQSYTLLPNDPKYVFPIPPSVILLTGMQQNPR